jgi:hypothetical protein
MINQVAKGDTVTIETGIKEKGENTTSHAKSSFETPFELPNDLPEVFDKYPKRLKKKTNTNQRITFSIDDEIKMTTDDANPTSLKDEPDNFPINRVSKITLTGTELDNILSRVLRFSDIVSLQNTETGGIKIRGDGGNATVEKEYNSKNDIADADSNPRFEFNCSGNVGVKSHYSVEYLVDFLKGVRKSNLKNPYTVKFDDESPLLIKRKLGTNSFIKTQISHRVVE